MATAVAHPNIALIKYWGKQDKPGNLPATPNLSITLDTLQTSTSVQTADEDRFYLNDELRADPKVSALLAAMRARFDIPPLTIHSSNNFPTGAGLASSASGFAALVTAINAELQLGLSVDVLSEWARQGSASAARSLFAEYVALLPPYWRAQPVAAANHWPLNTVIAITSTATKSVGSTEGMQISRTTSPYYAAWVNSSGDDYARAVEAVADRDFASLAAVAEQNCLKMHSLMLTSIPTLAYWNPTTVACMDRVRQLRADGLAVFFTIDAGPQVKAVCLPGHAEQVQQALAEVAGVLQTITCGLGGGARIVN